MTRAVDDHQRRYRRRILAVGAALFVLTFLISAPFLVSGVENDLEERVGDELAAAGFDGVVVRFSGQDGSLECAQPLDDPDTAAALAADEWGVRTVDLDPSCRGLDEDADAADAGPTTIDDTTTDSAPSTTSPATTSTTEVPDATTTLPPPEPDSLASLLGEDPQFSQFAGLLESSGATAELATGGPFTVFAPTDAAFDTAFEALGPDTFARLTADADLVERLVLHHVTDGVVTTAELVPGELTMLDGSTVRVAETDGVITLRSGDVVATVDPELVDLEASNGVVHAVDMVLLPADLPIRSDPEGEPQLSVALDGGRYTLAGTVATEAQRQALVAALAGDVAAANIDDRLVVDAAAGGTDDEVTRLARLVGAMPTNLAAGVTSSTDGALAITGVHLGADQLLAVETVATEIEASVELAARPVADPAAADELQAELNGFVRLNPIAFQPNSAELDAGAAPIVQQVAGRALVLDGVTIVIIGHTDSDGQPATNQQLSEGRAATVLDAFVDQGFDPDDVSSEGRGQTEPVLVDGVEDKAASRRVEFVVVADVGDETG